MGWPYAGLRDPLVVVKTRNVVCSDPWQIRSRRRRPKHRRLTGRDVWAPCLSGGPLSPASASGPSDCVPQPQRREQCPRCQDGRGWTSQVRRRHWVPTHPASPPGGTESKGRTWRDLRPWGIPRRDPALGLGGSVWGRAAGRRRVDSLGRPSTGTGPRRRPSRTRALSTASCTTAEASDARGTLACVPPAASRLVRGALAARAARPGQGRGTGPGRGGERVRAGVGEPQSFEDSGPPATGPKGQGTLGVSSAIVLVENLNHSLAPGLSKSLNGLLCIATAAET